MVRKLLFLLLSSFLFAGQAFAAMSSSIVFEFRDTATASMVNGGGFKTGASGTDYSQQNAAQWTAADGTSNASTTFTSATGGFTSAAIGNVLHLTAGTNGTVGWYEITAFTDGNTITLDRNCSTGAMTDGTYYIGGALSLNSTLDDEFFEEISGANTTDGVKVWFKNGSFTLGEAVSIAGAGGAQAPIVVEGYNTTRGDAPTGTSRPTITQAANAFTAGANFDFYNLVFTGTAADVFTLGSNGKIVNCKFTNTSSITARNALTTGNDFFVFNSEAVSYWGRGLLLGGSNDGTVMGSYFHDSDLGIRRGGTTQSPTIINNISADNVTAAYQEGSASTNVETLVGNTLYGAENKLGIGVSLATGMTDVRLLNNIIYGFVTGVSHADVQTVGFDDYNDYNNNTTDVANWTKGANDSTAAPGFTNVTQVTGTTGAFVAGGSKLVDLNKNFTTAGVAANDIVYITGGTGSTTRKYLISSISTTTNPNDTLNITVPASPGTNTTADKTYQITLGHDFSIGTNLKALGFPGAFQGGTTTGYMDIGGVQRQEPAGGGSVTVGYSYGQ